MTMPLQFPPTSQVNPTPDFLSRPMTTSGVAIPVTVMCACGCVYSVCEGQNEANDVCTSAAEIKKLVYWDMDKRLRVSAGISLWPSATGDAPVEHQSPTDEVTADMQGTTELHCVRQSHIEFELHKLLLDF